MAGNSFLSLRCVRKWHFVLFRHVGILTGRGDAESGPTMSGEQVLDIGVRGRDKECGGTHKRLENTRKIQ
jgi:hypothetical protein